MKPGVREKPITAEELAARPGLGPCELVDGRIVPLSPAGKRHGIVIGRVIRLVSSHVEKHDLGLVTSGETGFLVRRDPDRVRAPDIAFVSHDTLSLAEADEGAYFPKAPDLAIEVLSPDDAWDKVEEKARDYLGAGAKAVWVVSPAAEKLYVYLPGGPGRVLGRGDELEGGDALPGFRAPVVAFFDSPQRPRRRARRAR